MFIHDDLGNENSFKVKTLFHPAIPNNEDSLQVFDNDEKVLVSFANSKGEEEKNASIKPKGEVNYFDQEGILNLKNNYFLEDLLSQEIIQPEMNLQKKRFC